MKKVTIAILLIVISQLNASGQMDTMEYKTSPFQFTFMFPPFSTNGMDNANYVNNLSINIFTGLSGGVDGIEMGGFINVDRFFVKGFQAAGFGNSVSGYVDGVQLAGFYNVATGNVKSVQGAGFINTTGGNQFGLQGAGFANIVGGELFGFQGAGFMNLVGGKVSGVQGAGFMNVSGDTMVGIQGAGFVNVAGGFNKGVQGAGFGNIAGRGKVNVQGAGFFNLAEEVEGIQAAGFINVASYVRGIQAAGFINICDSIDGVPLGIINIVKYNGYRRFELAVSETQYANASFKLGVSRLYTIFSVAKPVGPASRWMFGAGLGSEFPLSEKSALNLELRSMQEMWMGDSRAPRFFHMNRYNHHNQLSVTFGRDLGNSAAFFVGPTLNVAVAQTAAYVDSFIPWEPLSPNWAFFDRTYNFRNQTNVAIWIGVKGGIRF